MRSYDEHETATREVLDAIGKVVDRYAIFPNKESRDAVVLWVAHSWVFKKFEATPRLHIYSSEPGSGKTRVMDLVCGMVRKSQDAVNARPSMIYEAIDMNESVTFSIDEVDNLFGRKGSNNAYKQLLAVLNAGFTSEGTTMAGSPGSYREMSLFTPVVMAGMGRLPDALHTRSIRIPMRKAGNAGNLEAFRARKVRFEFSQVKTLLEKWARNTGPALELLFPEIPLNDRDADKWEPLFAIAEMAGGDWLKRVARAARLLERDDAGDDIPMSTRILRDIENFIEERELEDDENVHTDDLIKNLIDMGWDARFVRPRSLAKILDDFGVESKNVRAYSYPVDDDRSAKKRVAKGYEVTDLRFACNEA